MNSITFLIIFMLAFGIVTFIVLYLYIDAYRKNVKASNNVINYDMFSSTFYYNVPMTKVALLNRLSIKSAYDEMDYNFNLEDCTITFIDNNAKRNYKLNIYDHDNYCILVVDSMHVLGTGGRFIYLMNPFWIRKLDAVPISYEDIPNANHP